jgi:hypothetical protein
MLMERIRTAVDWRWVGGWIVVVLVATQIGSQIAPGGSPAIEAATGGTASAFAAFFTNLVKRAWGGKDGHPPEIVPIITAGLFGVVGTVLVMVGLQQDVTQPAVASKAVVDGVLAGGGGAVMLSESFRAARPNLVDLVKDERTIGPCCTHTECRYNRVAPPSVGGLGTPALKG